MTRILLVEDNPDMQSLLKELLVWGGHEVACGRTGQEALEILRSAEEPPEVIISDLIMPNLDGMALLEAVRANPEWAEMRFIMMSANPHDARLKTEAVASLDGILPKPFSLEEITLILKRA